MQIADQRRSRRRERQREPNYRAESALTDLLENFLLRTPTADAMRIIKPIIDAIDRHPDKAHWILQGLIGVEDRQPNTAAVLGALGDVCGQSPMCEVASRDRR